MKKLISIFLSIMLIATLAACSGNKPAAGAASGDAPAASGDAIKWTMATIYAEPVGGNLTHMSLGAAMQKITRLSNQVITSKRRRARASKKGSGKQLRGPKATVKSVAKLIKEGLQMYLCNTVICTIKEGF